LITGTDEQARDYLKGVLACAIAIGVFFVVWSLILIALRCLGPYRVGMLSGKVPQVIKPDPSHSEESNGDKKEESIQKWEKKMRFQKRNRLVSRIIVLFCSLGIVVSALVMISLGAKELRNSISTTFEGLDETQENVNEAISMIDNYISLQNKIVLNITEFLNTLNESCPNLCSSLNATGSQCNFTDIPNGDQLESIFSNSKLYIIDKLEGYISDLQDVYDFISKIESTIKSFGWGEFYFDFNFVHMRHCLLTIWNIFSIYCCRCFRRAFGCVKLADKLRCDFRMERVTRFMREDNCPNHSLLGARPHFRHASFFQLALQHGVCHWIYYECRYLLRKSR
jgi:hypothetical protein